MALFTFIGPQAVQGGIWGEGTVGKYGVMWSAIFYASPSFFEGFQILFCFMLKDDIKYQS